MDLPSAWHAGGTRRPIIAFCKGEGSGIIISMTKQDTFPDASPLRKNQKIVGQTKNAGFEIGVRKTLSVSPQNLWGFIISNEGLKLWLHVDKPISWEEGAEYRASDGATGIVRIFTPGSHVRLTWQPGGWPKPSTLQVRVMPNGEKATLSFHQENLTGAEEREQMLHKWAEIVKKIEKELATDQPG